MEFKQIKPKKIYEEVADTLQQGIQSGHFKSGDKLASVQQLAENFQVSRSTIREALSALKAKGLIEIKQGEGTYVKEFNAGEVPFSFPQAALMNENDVKDLLAVRRIMETGAAGSAAIHRTQGDLRKLEKALREMKQANGKEELGEQADLHFHLAIASATQNSLLMNLLLNVSDIMQTTMKETRRIWLYSQQTTIEKIYEEHVRIYEAIKKQDENEATAAMLQHLKNVENVLSVYFRQKDKLE